MYQLTEHLNHSILTTLITACNRRLREGNVFTLSIHGGIPPHWSQVLPRGEGEPLVSGPRFSPEGILLLTAPRAFPGGGGTPGFWSQVLSGGRGVLTRHGMGGSPLFSFSQAKVSSTCLFLLC